MMKRRKCMADGGVLEKANERVRQAVGGIAAFLNVGRPATTEIVSGGRTNVPDGRQIVQADDRADMPQERNPRRFADEVDQRKQARSGGYESGGILLNDSADRLNQQAQVAPGGIASFLSGVQDAIRVPTQSIGPSLAQSSAPVGMSPQSQGLLTGIKDYSTTPAQLANSGKPAFVNEDGSPRNMGQSVQTVAQQPIMTMKERDIASGLDPNRAYRPGSAADPYASGIGAAATAQQSSYPADLARNPLAAAPARRPRRQVGYARGGILPVLGIGSGTSDSIPVVLAGHKVRVSNGEGVAVLPKKTMDTPGAVAAVESLIEQTNGKPPVPMKDGGEYAGGALPDEEELRRSQGQIGGAAFVRPQTAAAAPAKPPITAPEMYAPAYQAIAQAPAAAQGIAGRVFDALPEGGFLKDPAIRQKLGSVIAGDGLRPDVGLTGPRAVPQQTSFSNEGRDSAILASNLAVQAPPVASPPPIVAAKPDAAAGTADQASNRNGIVTSEMGRGFDPTKLTMAPGYGMASNAAGKTLSIGPSQYVAADGSQTSRWEDTQAYKDAIDRNEADKMRLAEMQSRRLGADPMAIQAASQGIASAILANKQTQAQMGRSAELQGMIKRAAAEQDAGKRQALVETILAAQGKDMKNDKEWTVFAGGQDAVDNGMGGKTTVDRPPIAFNHRTQQVIRLDGSSSPSGDVMSFANEAEAMAAQKAGKIKAGQRVRIGDRMATITP
jgi:hypothetical protein